jgi:crotonobetaine/carnitine-CoA ligase
VRTYRDLRPTHADQARWNLPWLLREAARTHGERVFLDVPGDGRRWTYAETLASAETIARRLLADGGEPGDRVLIMAPNSGEYVLTWFGAALAGMAEVPINCAYEGSFLEHQVRTTRPRVAVIDAAYAARFTAGHEAYASIERFRVLGAGAELERALATLRAGGWDAEPWAALTSGGRDAAAVALPEVRSRDLACVLFTSGTTGLSKGVMMPHAHMAFFADECVTLTRLTDADTYLCVGPLFHGNAQFLACYPALIAKARFVLREKFSASRWIDHVRDCGATVTNFVGVMMDWAYKQPPRPDDADNDLRCVFAAPTASSILEDFKRRFGIEAFVEVFGLTETAMPILSPYGEERPAGAAGLLADEFFDVRLVDPETDEEVPVGEVGELVVRAKLPWTMCAGYYGMPDKTLEATRNLWFHTGDGMRRDADGWYYFVDRLKDAIRRRGENISSYEVEQAVLGHPAVGECAAVAAPAGTEAGEDEVAIFVVPVAGARVSAEEVRAWCDQRLPAFARPEHVRVLESLPMTPSGKVRKVELRELVVRELAEPLGLRPRVPSEELAQRARSSRHEVVR